MSLCTLLFRRHGEDCVCVHLTACVRRVVSCNTVTASPVRDRRLGVRNFPRRVM